MRTGLPQQATPPRTPASPRTPAPASPRPDGDAAASPALGATGPEDVLFEPASEAPGGQRPLVMHPADALPGLIRSGAWLQVLESFERHSAAGKDQAAQQVFDQVRREPGRSSLRFAWDTGAPLAGELFKAFGMAKMCLHHLSNRPGDQQELGMVKDVLSAVYSVRSFLDTSSAFRRSGHYWSQEKQALGAIANEAKRLCESIEDEQFIGALCQNRPLHEEDEIRDYFRS